MISDDRLGYVLILILLLIAGCGNQPKAGRSLKLTLTAEADSFKVKDYLILDRPFEASPQQGLYEAQMLDQNGKLLAKTSFDMLTTRSDGNRPASDLTLVVPLPSEPDKLVVYRYDTRSGHYRLDRDNPLLEWKIPSQTSENEVK